MSVIGDTLFTRSDRASVSDVIRHVGDQLSVKVDAFDQRRFDAQSDEEVVAALSEELRPDPLEVDFDKGDKKVDEISLTVRDVFDGHTRVPGYRVTKTFPFSGDAGLWKFGTGQWGSDMPRGEVSGKTITVGMEVRSSDTESAVNHITSTVEQIKTYLALQKRTLDEFNASLPMRLLPYIQARRGRRSGAQALLDRL